MRHYSIYNLETGKFTGQVFGCDTGDLVAHKRAVEQNTPAGHGTIEGRHDHLSRKVDLEAAAREDDVAATAWAAQKLRNRKLRAAGEVVEELPPPARVEVGPTHVVDWQPPAPQDREDDYEWSVTIRRWVLSAVAAKKLADRRTAQREIATLEAQQHTFVRRLALNPQDEEARSKLQEIHNACEDHSTRL